MQPLFINFHKTFTIKSFSNDFFYDRIFHERDFMKKIILALMLIMFIFPVYADSININSQNAIVINLNDNSILYEKNSNEQVYIASLTKIMTAIVTIEQLNDLSKSVTITEEMLLGIYEYSKAGLQVGDVVTYEDLLYGIILPSGADCVQAVEITLGGRETFANLMNELANKLNLETTHFSNGIGMDNSNYSSVKDVATLLTYALKNETFYKVYTTKEYTMTNGLKVNSTLAHYDTLDTSLITGSKTGFTSAAGFCISVIYKSEDHFYLIVTTNANYTDGQPNHVIDALTIINYYLDNYHYLTLYKKDEVIASIPIMDSKQKKYDIKASEDIKLYLKKDIKLEDLQTELKQLENISKYNKKGDYLGTLNIKYDNKILYTKDLVLGNNINYKVESDKIIIIVLILFIILMLIYNILLRKKIHRLIVRLKRLK